MISAAPSLRSRPEAPIWAVVVGRIRGFLIPNFMFSMIVVKMHIFIDRL